MLNKLEQYIFYLFLFSIPFQTRKILYYEGWRFNEWKSVSVYATDVLLATLLLFWLINRYSVLSYCVLRITYYGKNLKTLIHNTKYIIQKPEFYLAAFVFISAISIKNSSDILISSYQWLKLVESIIFYLYLSYYAFPKFGLFNSFLTILAAGFTQALIAIVQLVRQSSIGLKYLGESIINGDIAGVASFYLPNGDKMIRAYGTLPHPNVLASFLLLALFAFYYIYLYSGPYSRHSSFVDTRDKALLFFYGVITFALLATFSRVVIFTWLVSSCFCLVIGLVFKYHQPVFGTKEGRKRITAVLLISTAVIVLFGSIYFNEIISRTHIDPEDQSIELRTFYNKQALESGTGINLFGVGVGNFVNWLIERYPYIPYYAYQPVHNIYLLIYSETGILGISAFLIFLIFLVRDFVKKPAVKNMYYLSGLTLLASVLFIGLFDHLFLTLQQGRLILWLVLALLTFMSKNDIISNVSSD